MYKGFLTVTCLYNCRVVTAAAESVRELFVGGVYHVGAHAAVCRAVGSYKILFEFFNAYILLLMLFVCAMIIFICMLFIVGQKLS